MKLKCRDFFRVFAAVVLLASVGLYAQSNTSPSPSQFILDMVHHNPGEAKTQTMFLDPVLLKDWGYNGDIPRVFVQAAVTFDSVDKDTFPAGSKQRKWVEDNARAMDQLIAGMKS